MAEILIVILAEHNVPINFADHFIKLVSNKLVFPDSVFLCVRAVRAPCSLKVVIARVVTNCFFRNLTGLNDFMISLHERMFCRIRGSNPHPSEYQADAYPTKLPCPAFGDVNSWFYGWKFSFTVTH